SPPVRSPRYWRKACLAPRTESSGIEPVWAHTTWLLILAKPSATAQSAISTGLPPEKPTWAPLNSISYHAGDSQHRNFRGATLSQNSSTLVEGSSGREDIVDQ